jgi:outer membrane lipoprotein-sorting protein
MSKNILKGMMIKMKKAILCILMCLVLMLSFAACKNKDGSSDTTAPDTTEGTTSSLEDIMSALSGLDSTDPSSADTTEATEPVTMPKGHEIKDNGAKKDIKKTRFYTYFQKNSKRDSYTMTATCSSNMQGASVNMPLTMVKSGKKAYMSMKAPLGNGVAMTMSFISDGQKFYMVFPEARMYLALDASEAGDVNEAMGSLSAIDFEGMEYVKTSEVKADGKKYICEEYKSNDSTIKCYFYGDELVKMEILSSEGVLVCDDIKFSSKVDESLFKVPAGYTDISAAYGTGGGFPGLVK